MEKEELYIEKFKNIDKQLVDLESRQNESEDKIVNLDKAFEISFTRTSIALETLAGLPKAIQSMEKTNEEIRISLIQLSGKVDNLGNDVSILKNKVDSIDNEGKMNIRKFIQDHIGAVIVGIAVLVALGTWGISYLIGLIK